jgi:rare lipoprotein A
MEQLTAAHRTLPFGTWVEVTDLQNQKIVDVRINDRGPFIDGRIIDLSLAAARAIDMVGPGVARVRLRVIAPPVLAANKSAPPPVRIPPAPTPAQPIAPLPSLAPQQPSIPVVESYAVQAGAFSERDDAEKFQATIRSQFEETRVLLLQSAWRVLVGRQLTFEDANRLASKVLAIAGQAVVVKDR